jgi:predicted membrane channel-forming protein YqfA (hemolysin III family)
LNGERWYREVVVSPTTHQRQDVSIPLPVGLDKSYYYTNIYKEENSVYDAWSAAIVYLYLFVVVAATTAHPFSMQSFLIVIAFGMAVILMKIVVIDEGCPEPVLERLSIPDLVTGLVLVAVGLLFFVLDSWMLYQYFHSLWHFFSALGIYFYAAGITKNTPLHHSPFNNMVERFKYVRRKKRRERDLSGEPTRFYF